MHTSRCFGFYPSAESILVPLPGEQTVFETQGGGGTFTFGGLARVNALWVSVARDVASTAPATVLSFEWYGRPSSVIYIPGNSTGRYLVTRDCDRVTITLPNNAKAALWTEAVAGFNVEDRP